MDRRRYSFWIDIDLLDGLRAIRERDGILESEQIRRAIRQWLKSKGIKKPECKRAGTRRRGGGPR